MTEINETTINDIEQELLVTDWVEEAKEIPLDKVEDPKDQIVLIKCINKEPMNQEEITRLKKVLKPYRDALVKYEPEEALENVDHNLLVAKSEEQFLNLLLESDKKRTFTMYYPLDEKEIEVTLQVNKVRDPRAIIGLQDSLKLFEDFTKDEIEKYQAYTNKEPQSREDKIIAQRLAEKVEEKTTENQRDVMIEFLARQTEFPDGNSTYEGMKQIYEHIDLAPLAAIFTEVQKLSGFGDVDTDKMFRNTN